METIKDLAIYYHEGRADSNCSLCNYVKTKDGKLHCNMNDRETTKNGRCGIISLKGKNG